MAAPPPSRSKSRRNLWIAFIEEAKANRLYVAYAQRAREEGHARAAEIFEKVSQDETRHALNHLKALGLIKSTAENLAGVVAEERAEATGAFPRMLEQVRAEGDDAAERSLQIALDDSLGHVKLFEEALASVGGAPAAPAPAAEPEPHEPSAEVKGEKSRIAKLERIREVVFGMQDGLLSTLTVAATVMLATGSRLDTLVAGVAAALAGVVGMSSGAYLSSQAEKELHEAEIAHEREELASKPEEETAELLQVLRQEGYTYEEALAFAERADSDPALMLRTQAEKELGFAVETAAGEDPLLDAFVMGIFFFVGSALSLFPYLVWTNQTAVCASIAVSLLTLFVLGALKTLVTRRNPWLSGLQVFTIGAFSALASFLLGDFLPKFFVGR